MDRNVIALFESLFGSKHDDVNQLLNDLESGMPEVRQQAGHSLLQRVERRKISNQQVDVLLHIRMDGDEDAKTTSDRLLKVLSKKGKLDSCQILALNKIGLCEQIQYLNDKIEFKEEVISTEKSTIHLLLESMHSLRRRGTALQEKIDELHFEESRLTLQVYNLEEELSYRNQKNQLLNEEISTLESRIAGLKRAIANAPIEAEELRLQKAMYESKISNANKEEFKLILQGRALDEGRQQIELENQKIAERFSKMESNIQELRKEIYSLNGRYEKALLGGGTFREFEKRKQSFDQIMIIEMKKVESGILFLKREIEKIEEDARMVHVNEKWGPTGGYGERD